MDETNNNVNSTPKFALSEKELDREAMLAFMIERQHNNPSEKNYAAFVNILKSASVYVPVTFNFTEEEKKRIAEDIKAGRDVKPAKDMSFAPQLLVHRETGEKVMPWFTREFEINQSKAAQNMSFVRIPVVQMLDICDNMPDAFDILIDPYTHPYKMSLDTLIEAVNGEVGEGVNVLSDEF